MVIQGFESAATLLPYGLIKPLFLQQNKSWMLLSGILFLGCFSWGSIPESENAVYGRSSDVSNLPGHCLRLAFSAFEIFGRVDSLVCLALCGRVRSVSKTWNSDRVSAHAGIPCSRRWGGKILFRGCQATPSSFEFMVSLLICPPLKKP